MGRPFKYFVKDGRTVQQYCKETPDAPPINTVLNRIHQCGWSLDKAVTEPVPKKNLVYGIPLKKYCREHGLNYPQIYMTWRGLTQTNKVRRKDVTLEQFIEDYLKGVKYDIDNSTYFYKGYCESKGLNYASTYGYWRAYKSDEYTFRQYVDYKAAKKTATDLELMSVKDYCEMKGYDTAKIRNRYSLFKRHGGRLSLKDFVRQWEKDNGYGRKTA